MQPLPPDKLEPLWKCTTASNCGTLAFNWQNTSSPKYNDDISLLIRHHVISRCYSTILLTWGYSTLSPAAAQCLDTAELGRGRSCKMTAATLYSAVHTVHILHYIHFPHQLLLVPHCCPCCHCTTVTAATVLLYLLLLLVLYGRLSCYLLCCLICRCTALLSLLSLHCCRS
jgi:hypothetical protein